MRLFGQDDWYDFYNPASTDVAVDYAMDYAVDYVEPYVDIYSAYYDPGTGVTEMTSTYDYPSESRYVTSYQEQQATIQAQVASGGGFLNIFKSILGIAAPVVTSIVKAGQTPTTTVLPKTSTGVPVRTSSIGGIISSITSSPILLIGLGVGGFLLLRGRGRK